MGHRSDPIWPGFGPLNRNRLISGEVQCCVKLTTWVPGEAGQEIIVHAYMKVNRCKDRGRDCGVALYLVPIGRCE